MEPTERTIKIEYKVVTLTTESRATVLNMITNILRPLTYADTHSIVSGLCDEFGVRDSVSYDD